MASLMGSFLLVVPFLHSSSMTDSKLNTRASQWHPGLIRALTTGLNDIFSGGFYADKVIERTFKSNRKWGGRDRRFLAETIYDMVRWWNLLARFDGGEFVLSSEALYLRRWSFYEAWKHKMDTSFFLQEKLQIEKSPDDSFEKTVSKIQNITLEPWEKVAFPHWLFEKFLNQFGDEANSLMIALNESAPVCLRVNTLKISRKELVESLEAEGLLVTAPEDSKEGIILKERKNVFLTDAFKKGYFEVQDLASQKVSLLLDPRPGERIADVCAGAGGKTLHLAALMQNKGSLLGGDNYDRKLEQLKIRARRAGVSNLRIQEFKSTKDIKKHHEKFDGVLIDSPCSGTGVIRRNADTKWKLSPDEVTRLIETQRKIILDYSKMVKLGGRLVYATCSLLKEENQNQIDWFLAQSPGWTRDGEPLITRPDKDKLDGFFAQKLTRKIES